MTMANKALVTGASGGIGLAFARRLARSGYEITAVARSEGKLHALVTELGPGHEFLIADLASADGQGRVADALTRQHFDLLVNNAGVGVIGSFAEVPLERTLAMLHLNCEALVTLAHAFLQNARPGDALINVGSTLSFLPAPTVAAYCATKSFVVSFSEALWVEQKARDVFVMALCPGITATQFQINAGGRFEDLPRRMIQTPEQVVDVALNALAKRHNPTVISGLKNLIFATLARLLTRRAVVTLMGRAMPTD